MKIIVKNGNRKRYSKTDVGTKQSLPDPDTFIRNLYLLNSLRGPPLPSTKKRVKGDISYYFHHVLIQHISRCTSERLRSGLKGVVIM